ncbi:MAG: SGNH/GDSL hydrolase family protein [Thermoanaerobaculia bacterium]
MRRKLVSLMILGLLLEGSTRLALRSETVVQRMAAPFDSTAWKLSWLRRHFAGAEPYRFGFDRHHPIRGWTLAPGLRAMPVFAGKNLTTNSRGLRGAREFPVTKTPGVTRIALFGDSFTFGEGVGDEETYASQIERLAPGVEVMNFGVHGYGLDQMLLYVREALPEYRPDVVLVGAIADDFLRNMLTFRDFAKPRFELREGRLDLEGVPVPTPEALLATERWRSRFVDLVTMGFERIAWRWGGRAKEMDRLGAEILATIAREARAGGARPAFASLPAWGELGAIDPASLPGERLIAELSRRESVPCVLLRPVFLARAKLGMTFEQRGHWRAKEHRIAAEGIVDFLRREDLIP